MTIIWRVQTKAGSCMQGVTFWKTYRSTMRQFQWTLEGSLILCLNTHAPGFSPRNCLAKSQVCTTHQFCAKKKHKKQTKEKHRSEIFKKIVVNDTNYNTPNTCPVLCMLTDIVHIHGKQGSKHLCKKLFVSPKSYLSFVYEIIRLSMLLSKHFVCYYARPPHDCLSKQLYIMITYD